MKLIGAVVGWLILSCVVLAPGIVMFIVTGALLHILIGYAITAMIAFLTWLSVELIGR